MAKSDRIIFHDVKYSYEYLTKTMRTLNEFFSSDEFKNDPDFSSVKASCQFNLINNKVFVILEPETIKKEAIEKIKERVNPDAIEFKFLRKGGIRWH